VRKTLGTVVLTVLTLASAARAEFPSTNSERGCKYLQITVITRNEELSGMNEALCKKVKDETGGDIAKCYYLYTLIYNGKRGRGDTNRLPTHISERIMKGCGMVIYDISEEQMDATMERVR
jgi:hypothetical protein